MDDEIKNKILEANIFEHAKEAVVYEIAHPEIFRSDAQKRICLLLEIGIQNLKSGGVKALDLGCGTGNIAMKLLDKGLEVDAVDLSEQMINEFKNKISDDKKGAVRVYVAPVDDFLRDNGEMYDVITTSSLLHHLPDYKETIKNAARKLKHGGVMMNFHEPTGENMPMSLKRLPWVDAVVFNLFFLPARARRVVFSIDYSFMDYQIGRGFSQNKVVEALSSSGLEIKHIARYNSFKLRISNYLLDCFTKRKLEFSIVCQKPL